MLHVWPMHNIYIQISDSDPAKVPQKHGVHSTNVGIPGTDRGVLKKTALCKLNGKKYGKVKQGP
jgi:hypothetical protein